MAKSVIEPASDAREYLGACHEVFRERPEVDRIALYADRVQREPHSPIPIYRLAAACLDGGSLALWRQGVSLAQSYPHETPRALFERSLVKLRLGDWSAWRDYEARVYNPDWGLSRASSFTWRHRIWDGTEDLADKTLLVTQQGGFGDGIWSLRLVPSVAARVRHFAWCTHTPLLELVRHNFGSLGRFDAIDTTSPDTQFDRYVLAMSIPSFLEEPPPFVPLAAPAPCSRNPSVDRPARIGLTWACSIDGLDHLERSVPLSVLAPFFWRTDIQWYSLQLAPRNRDGNYYPGLRQPDVPLATFADTANYIAGLDGIISVDTAVCHLAGVLGVPTIVLLKFAHDPKWGLDDSTPWYPYTRLIRQCRPGDWESVAMSVRRALDGHWWAI